MVSTPALSKDACLLERTVRDRPIAVVYDPCRVTAEVPDPAGKRAFEAMMQMGKIDIAAIEAARRG